MEARGGGMTVMGPCPCSPAAAQGLAPPAPLIAPPPPPLTQPENIVTLTKAAGIEVEPYWPALFAKLIEKKSVDDFIVNVGAGERPGARWRAGGGDAAHTGAAA